MNVINEVCRHCSGIGYTNIKLIPLEDGLHFREERDICNQCNGTGKIANYAVFSVEEAKAILKHCGLTTES